MQKSRQIKNNCSAIILAAGRSERMGKPKFSLRFDKENNFLDAIIKRYISLDCKKIVAVLNKTGIDYYRKNPVIYPENVVFIENKNIDKGRFFSIKTGIKQIDTFPVFIHNVDNPFVSQEVLRKLLSCAGKDFVAPYFNEEGGHPVLLSQKIGTDILKEKKENIIFYEFLKRYKKTKVQVGDNTILVNINTMEEYNRYISL